MATEFVQLPRNDTTYGPVSSLLAVIIAVPVITEINTKFATPHTNTLSTFVNTSWGPNTSPIPTIFFRLHDIKLSKELLYFREMNRNILEFKEKQWHSLNFALKANFSPIAKYNNFYFSEDIFRFFYLNVGHTHLAVIKIEVIFNRIFERTEFVSSVV